MEGGGRRGWGWGWGKGHNNSKKNRKKKKSGRKIILSLCIVSEFLWSVLKRRSVWVMLGHAHIGQRGMNTATGLPQYLGLVAKNVRFFPSPKLHGQKSRVGVESRLSNHYCSFWSRFLFLYCSFTKTITKHKI